MAKTFFVNAIILVISLITGLLLSEISLRSLGYYPWQPYDRNNPAEPTIYQADPEIGWVHKAGKYTMAAYHVTAQPIKYTFYADGSRATSSSNSDIVEPESDLSELSKIVIVGCSFSEGFAISDDETYA